MDEDLRIDPAENQRYLRKKYKEKSESGYNRFYDSPNPLKIDNPYSYTDTNWCSKKEKWVEEENQVSQSSIDKYKLDRIYSKTNTQRKVKYSDYGTSLKDNFKSKRS